MNRISWLALALGMLFTGVHAAAQTNPNPPVPLPYGAALVIDVKGQVTATPPQGAPVQLQKGHAVVAETSIETGKGTLVLGFADGSQVLLKPQCHVVIKAPNKAEGNFIELLLGRLLAKVQKRLGQEPSFKLGTPTAVVAVRGTHFGVEVTAKRRTYVQVYEGEVAVSAIAIPGASILLRPGFATHVDIDRAPQRPHQMHDLEPYTGPRTSGDDNEPGARDDDHDGRPQGDSGRIGRSGKPESEDDNLNPKQKQKKQPSEGPD